MVGEVVRIEYGKNSQDLGFQQSVLVSEPSHFRGGAHIEFVFDQGCVIADSFIAETEFVGDLPRRVAFGQQAEHVEFARRKRVQICGRILSSNGLRQEFLSDFRFHIGFSAGHFFTASTKVSGALLLVM